MKIALLWESSALFLYFLTCVNIHLQIIDQTLPNYWRRKFCSTLFTVPSSLLLPYVLFFFYYFLVLNSWAPDTYDTKTVGLHTSPQMPTVSRMSFLQYDNCRMQLLTATLLFPGAKSSSAISTHPKERTAKDWKPKKNKKTQHWNLTLKQQLLGRFLLQISKKKKKKRDTLKSGIAGP